MMFEQGPIRPPSEAGSLLLRFTRNCPWNNCTFCPIYKGTQFSRRTLAEIKQDVDMVAKMIQELRALSETMGYTGRVNQQVLNSVLTNPSYDACFRHVAMWSYYGKGTVFIQDANSLVLSTGTLVEAFSYLKNKIPAIKRITSYARSSTLVRKSLDELRQIRTAGLDRIHIGLESGSDQVLKFIKKGVTAKEHVAAGQKVVEAGMSLSEYIMPGLGGKTWSREHAVETARVLNAIDPHFIRLRSLRIPPNAPLYQDKVKGEFVPLHDDEIVAEIRLFIERLEGIHSTLTSDHIMNLLEEVGGTFPDDKQSMLDVIDRYLALPDEDRLLFRLGRRGGAVRSLADLQNASLKERLAQASRDLMRQAHDGDLERIITELGDQYI